MPWSTKKLGAWIFWTFVLTTLFSIIFKFREFFNKNTGLLQAILTAVLVIITAYYAWQTRKTVKEMSRQTNLQQMPIIMLYIRDIRDSMNNIADYDEQQKMRRKFENFLIRIRTENGNSNYYLALRNVGNGAAFNIEVKSDAFEIVKYQSRFLAPSKDEQPFAIIQKGNKKIESWGKFKDSVFEISCKDISGTAHLFKYKIAGIENKKVDFIEHK